MIVVFRDVNGTEGRVTRDLTLTYDGEWERRIRACHRRVVSEHRQNHDAVDPDAVLEELVIELPEEAPVRATELVTRPR